MCSYDIVIGSTNQLLRAVCSLFFANHVIIYSENLCEHDMEQSVDFSKLPEAVQLLQYSY